MCRSKLNSSGSNCTTLNLINVGWHVSIIQFAQKKRKQSLRKRWNFDLLSVIGYIHSIVVHLQHQNISKYPKLHIYCLKIMERIRNIAIAKIAMLFRHSLTEWVLSIIVLFEVEYCHTWWHGDIVSKAFSVIVSWSCIAASYLPP